MPVKDAWHYIDDVRRYVNIEDGHRHTMQGLCITELWETYNKLLDLQRHKNFHLSLKGDQEANYIHLFRN